MKTNIGTDTLTHEAKPHICASWGVGKYYFGKPLSSICNYENVLFAAG